MSYYRDLDDLSAFPKFPSAHHFGVYMCSNTDCSAAHIVLFDAEDTPIAQMTIGPANLSSINAACHDLFSEKGVWK